MFNSKTIQEAINEAERFLKRARAVRADFNERSHDHSYYYDQTLTAAARRSSMDLTRALADLRRPQ